MLFATTSMAARIELAEADTAREFAERARVRNEDVLIAPIGGTHAVYAGPGQPFNKLAGLGFAPVEDRDFEVLEAGYDARSAEIRVEQSTLADPAVASLLTRRGYVLSGYENVLGLDLRAAHDDLSRLRDEDLGRGLEIARAGPSDLRAWIATLTDGFLHPDRFDGPPPTESFPRDVLEGVLVDLGSATGTSLYMARRNGEIAGGASLRICTGLAQLTGASTLPAHRRRGVQSALLRARLLDAADSGCDLAVVTTEPASKSQQNVQRAGFALLYSRAVLIRPVTSAQ
jgi:ribosomal protein S18 acetylase RimI-like enzyme